MRSGSLITLSYLISSIIAINPFSNQEVIVSKTDHNVQCGDEVYSIPELLHATIHGCKSIMRRYKCGEAGKCEVVKKFVGPKDYTGPGFELHDKRVYIWGLPMRQGSNFVSNALFDIDPFHRRCKTLGASYQMKSGGKIQLCQKLEPKSFSDVRKSHSPPRQRTDSHSPPRQRTDSHSPPRQRTDSRSPSPDRQGSSRGNSRERSHEAFHESPRGKSPMYDNEQST